MAEGVCGSSITGGPFVLEAGTATSQMNFPSKRRCATAYRFGGEKNEEKWGLDTGR